MLCYGVAFVTKSDCVAMFVMKHVALGFSDARIRQSVFHRKSRGDRKPWKQGGLGKKMYIALLESLLIKLVFVYCSLTFSLLKRVYSKPRN